MKRIIIFACCLLVLVGCGKSDSVNPSSEKGPTDAGDQYRQISIGGFETSVPSSWSETEDGLYPGEVGYYPLVTLEVLDEYESLDSVFNYGNAINEYMDGCGEAFERISDSSSMCRRTFGNSTGLYLTMGGLKESAKIGLFSALFSNPGGGIARLSIWFELDGERDPVDDYIRMLYNLSPVDGLPSPSDSFQPSTGDVNALASAKLYLNAMNFSYSGLIEQLKAEGYTERECTYAADNCNASWREQAIGSAKAYLASYPYSRAELIDQLISEGFDRDDAEYAVSQVYD